MIDYGARRKKVQRSLLEQGVDLLLVGPGDNMTYLLGFHPHADERPCFYLLTPRGSGFLMPALNAEDARAQGAPPMSIWADHEGPRSALERLALELDFASVERVLLDETMRTDFSLLVLEYLPRDRETGLASEVLSGFRMRKDKEEVALLQSNAAIADRAMQAAFAAIKPGVTESEVARAASDAFLSAGVDRVTFTIVGAGPNAAYPHHATGQSVLQAGDAVVIDIGARKELYNSDITRMAFVGEPSAHYLEVHALVEAAVQAALASIKPGIAAEAVDRAARDVISGAGYGEYFVHRTGHGLGLSVHELPNISASSETTLEEGMVFSVEPGIYLPGEFGIRLEEIVLVTAEGSRVFSTLTRNVQAS